MSLPDELSRIKHPNWDLFDWFESIEDKNRLREIFEDIGRQLQRKGVRNRTINSAYLKLAEKSIISLKKLSEDEIYSYSCSGRGRTTPVSRDDNKNDIFETNSDDNISETNNEIQELLENNAAESLNNVPVEDNELKETYAEDGPSKEVFNPEENNEIQPSIILTPSSALQVNNVGDRPTVFEKTPNSRDIFNSEENNEIQPSIILTPSSALQVNNVGDRPTVFEKTPNNRVIFNPEENNEIQSIVSLTPPRALNESNVKGSSDTFQTDQSSSREVINLMEIKTVQSIDSLAVKDNVKEINNEENTLAIDKSAVDKELNIQSTTSNLEDAPINDPEGSKKEISKEGGVSSVSEEFGTSNLKIKPPTNREVVLMKSLRDRLSIKLNKKNIYLPASSINMQPAVTGGETPIAAQSVVKKAEANSQKPQISVRTNIFEHRNEKSLKYPEVNAMQINKTGVVGTVSGDVSTNTNIRQHHFEGSTELGSDKVKEQHKHKEDKSKSSSTFEDASNLNKSLKQMNVELHKIKKIAESRKRVSENSGEKIKTVKMRRLSEQCITTKAQETHMQEKQVESNNKTAREVLHTQEPTVLNDNVSTHQSLSWKNPPSMPTTNPPLTMLSESNKTSVTVPQNESQNVSRTPQEINIQSLLDSRQPQPCNALDPNTGSRNTILSQVKSSEASKTSMNMAMKMGQTSSSGKTLNQSISNLYRRKSLDSAQVSASNPLLASQLANRPNIALGVKSSATGGTILVSEHSKNVASPVIDRSDVSRLGSESLAVPLNNQSSPNIQASVSAPEQTTPATSNQPTAVGKTTLEINQIVEKATRRFLLYFCNRSDDNLGAVPAEVRSCLNQYCINSLRPPFKKVTEFLKLYMVCYIRFFNSEEISKTISKLAELLHLSVADSIRRTERREQAKKLQSNILREEEISRANKDYDDILILRGAQFVEMFKSVVPKISQVKSFEYMMLVIFYFKITQALMMIDRENEAYIFQVRDLMKQLLISSRKPFSFDCLSLFKDKVEDFKTNCLFVKQCLLTLYLSGYHEVETEHFWRLIRFKPSIATLQQILQPFQSMSQHNSRTQTVGSSSCPTGAGTSENIHRADLHPTQMNVRLQTSAETRSGPSQYNSSSLSVKIPNAAVQHRIQNVQQAQGCALARVGIPSQLPPFASLNQPNLFYHHLSQRSQPAPSNIQANQGFYHPANRGQQQAAKSSSSTSSQSQLSRQNVAISPTPNYHPPPPYPGTAAQPRVGPETNQLWQPGGAAPVMMDDANMSFDDLAESMTQMCATAGCTRLATLVCSLCRAAVYCTTDCQANDWYENHSKICLH